jgi:hypothetical protein
MKCFSALFVVYYVNTHCKQSGNGVLLLITGSVLLMVQPTRRSDRTQCIDKMRATYQMSLWDMFIYHSACRGQVDGCYAKLLHPLTLSCFVPEEHLVGRKIAKWEVRSSGTPGGLQP